MEKRSEDPFAPDPDTRILRSPKWVRAVLGGVFIADSRRVLLSRQPGRLPRYFFPRAEVREELLLEVSREREGSSKITYDLQVGDRRIAGAALAYADPRGALAPLADHVFFRWDVMDAWFEEEEEVFVHPRDPYKRVEAARSTREVRVAVDGAVVAESRRPVLVFETALPTRYYLPKCDVRMDRLEAVEETWRCPYKGHAHYYAVHGGAGRREHLAWWFPYPLPAVAPVAGHVAFLNEQVDHWVDGELEARPESPFS